MFKVKQHTEAIFMCSRVCARKKRDDRINISNFRHVVKSLFSLLWIITSKLGLALNMTVEKRRLNVNIYPKKNYIRLHLYPCSSFKRRTEHITPYYSVYSTQHPAVFAWTFRKSPCHDSIKALCVYVSYLFPLRVTKIFHRRHSSKWWFHFFLIKSDTNKSCIQVNSG